jgi:hypothetical protein
MAGKTNLNGFYKTRYGEKQKLVPEWAILQELLPFKTKARTGKDFREPVFLKRSHGVTFAGGTTAGTIYDLNTAIAPQSEEVVVTAAEITMREQLAYGAISAAEGAGEEAFGAAMDELVLGLDESARFYVETLLAYGQTNIGIIETVTADTATTKILTISKVSWAPGIWAQAEGMKLDVYDSTGVTKINVNAVSYFTSNYNPDARQILWTGHATDAGLLVAGQVLVFATSASGTASPMVFAGLDKIITNTGTLFGISAATYGLWKGNILDAGSNPATMSTFHSAAIRAARGGQGDLVFLLNTYAFQDLADDQAALRRYAEKTKGKFENGASDLVYYGAQGGKMTFRPHMCLKAGDAFGIMPDKWVRGGDTDLVDKLTGPNNDHFFSEIADKSGVEFRLRRS